MANCNKLFIDLNKLITPTDAQMEKMKVSRVALEEKISKKLKEELGMTPSYFTQGSGAKNMKTIIVKEDGTYDADRGVYLPSKPGISADKVQSLVFDAVNGHTTGGAEHRNKCIRVIYSADYNIDFPIYHEVADETYSYLALKTGQWITDDPSKMIEWFVARKDQNGQLIRIVKYLKAWASHAKPKMPSGIALTVWAAKFYVANEERDDIALSMLLHKLVDQLAGSVACISPVEPFDDLTAKLSEDQKELFYNELVSFSAFSRMALDEPNQLVASKLWRKHLGDRFQLGVDEDITSKERALRTLSQTVLSGAARLNRDGQINDSAGVQHQQHRNYGF